MEIKGLCEGSSLLSLLQFGVWVTDPEVFLFSAHPRRDRYCPHRRCSAFLQPCLL